MPYNTKLATVRSIVAIADVGVAEWSGGGPQNRSCRFESCRQLDFF